MFIAFVPFPTAVLAQRLGSGVDAVGATLLAFINPILSLLGFGLFAAYWALPFSGPTTDD